MDRAPVDILLVNLAVSSRSGTEVLTRDLAFALQRRGHRPMVYSPTLGPVAQEIVKRGIDVVNDVAAVPRRPDIIHGQHHPTTVTALARFWDVPAIFYAHDSTSWHDIPPALPRILRYIAVDHTVRDGLAGHLKLPVERIGVILNGVDLERFGKRAPLPERPRRALELVKGGKSVAAIKDACEMAGIHLECLGQGIGRPVDAPEDEFGAYDLVFSSARSALEAMAVGSAVIVCDSRGLAGLVTPGNYDRWRPLNFGLRTLNRTATVEVLRTEIGRYDAAAATAVRARVRAEAGLDLQVDALEALYRVVIEEWRRLPPPQHEAESAALGAYLQDWLPNPSRLRPWDEQLTAEMMDITGRSARDGALEAERNALAAALQGTRTERDALATELGSIKASKALRLAAAVGRHKALLCIARAAFAVMLGGYRALRSVLHLRNS